MALEVVGTRAFLASAEVKCLATTLRRITQEFPVHKIIWRQVKTLLQRAAVVRQHLILIKKRQNAGDNLSLMFDQKNLALLAQRVEKSLEIAQAIHRRSQIAHAFGINVVKLTHTLVIEDRSQPVFPTLADHSTLLARDAR